LFSSALEFGFHAFPNFRLNKPPELLASGATLALSGRQAGLIVAADLNGLVISLR